MSGKPPKHPGVLSHVVEPDSPLFAELEPIHQRIAQATIDGNSAEFDKALADARAIFKRQAQKGIADSKLNPRRKTKKLFGNGSRRRKTVRRRQ